MFVGMIAQLTVAHVAVSVAMVMAALPVVLMHGVCLAVLLGRLGRISARPVVSQHQPALLASGLVTVDHTLANCDVKRTRRFSNRCVRSVCARVGGNGTTGSVSPRTDIRLDGPVARGASEMHSMCLGGWH